MLSLPELQRRMAAALADPLLAAEAARLFRGPPERVQEMLAIHRGNALENCTKALRSAYPVVRKIVGEAFFDELVRAFMRLAPPTMANLNLYGAEFESFLGEFPPVADLPYLEDVARLEWQAHLAHFAPDAVAFDYSSLSRNPPETYADLRLRLAPHCSLLESRWPLARLWAVHQDEYAGALEVDLGSGPDCVLVFRDGWRARAMTLAAGEFAFLGAASRGEKLGNALEDACGADSRFSPSTALARWIDARVIVGLE